MKYISNVGATVLNVILFLFAIYGIWGWIVVAEIRATVEARGYDIDTVFNDILASHEPGYNVRMTNGTSVDVAPGPPSKYPEFTRLAPQIRLLDIDTTDNATPSPKINDFNYPLIGPFLVLPKEFLNFLFSLSLGYIMSISFLLAKLLRKVQATPTYIVLKPFAGALATGCLFLFVLSGGHIFLEGKSPVSTSGIGVLAVIGSLWAERFDKFLKSATV